MEKKNERSVINRRATHDCEKTFANKVSRETLETTVTIISTTQQSPQSLCEEIGREEIPARSPPVGFDMLNVFEKIDFENLLKYTSDYSPCR
ncbi:hypothetical protein E2986_13795 [Frieseomelitta varia]|uniref:Uncharacterized protein n=1 Tax=Frieseomelitta varia TaxID=561572 RepID=A0A833S483_9HYME|nr:hypothetical protein E2986_13795 [Frieseomelitta varia]